MKKKDFSCSIAVHVPPQQAYEGILQIPKWWTIDVTGQSHQLHDEFIIQHGVAHFSRHKLIEMDPPKRLVWLITESHLGWLKGNKQEWTNTRTIFNIQPKDRQTIIRLTHQGLVPELECFYRCADVWETVIMERLLDYLTKGIELG